MSLLERLLKRKSALESTVRPVATPDRSAAERSVGEPPESVDQLMAGANAQFQSGDRNAARELYKRVLELEPSTARAYYMLGGIAVHDGDVASAIGLLERAIALQPVADEFHFSLAGLHLSLGDQEKALRSYLEARRLKPASLHYQRSVAGAFIAAGRLNDGVESYRAIASAAPVDAQAWLQLGQALHMRGDLEEADETFARAVRLSPEAADAHMHLALIRRERGRPIDAESSARQAVALAPNMYQAWFVLGGLLSDQGRHDEAVEQFRKAIVLQPDYDAAWSGVLFSMNYSDRFSPREIFEEHVKYGALFENVAPMVVDAARSQPGRRVRIGYLSPDLWQHPVAHFMLQILSHHDRNRFEVFCYHTGKRQDAMTARLKGHVEHWRREPAISDDDLERWLRADGLDILVELSGHSDGQRLGVLARRVAPVQATYLGYPNTTGVAAIDYRITDAHSDPEGESDRIHVEKLIRLPGSFLCYAPPEADDEAQAAPVHRNGRVTFASFNNFIKLSARTIELWSRILGSVRDSKLMIKTRGLQEPGLRRLLLERFEERGIDPIRIAIMQPVPDHREHMRAYGEVDIALDPFPYHGTTTTMEALWMGVPVVTLEGDRHASRVGRSILYELDLAQLVARTEDQYVDIASRLAADPAALETLRQSLRSRLSRSTLTDGARFTAQLEDAYLQMWREALARSGVAA
jgi:protein O-GlcNAc transferase